MFRTFAAVSLVRAEHGQTRQITLFEDGAPVLQVLTSDLAAPAAALLAWLRCWWLCDYRASLEMMPA